MFIQFCWLGTRVTLNWVSSLAWSLVAATFLPEWCESILFLWWISLRFEYYPFTSCCCDTTPCDWKIDFKTWLSLRERTIVSYKLKSWLILHHISKWFLLDNIKRIYLWINFLKAKEYTTVVCWSRAFVDDVFCFDLSTIYYLLWNLKLNLFYLLKPDEHW